MNHILITPTGVSALNIRSKTLHSASSFPFASSLDTSSDPEHEDFEITESDIDDLYQKIKLLGQDEKEELNKLVIKR